MTEEFKKARDYENMDKLYCTWPGDQAFEKGADFAYEYLTEQARLDQEALRIKLTIAVEALEKIAKREYPMAEQALSKIVASNEAPEKGDEK